MSSLAVFVGIDYHQEKVQLCLLDGEGRVLMNRPCENHWRNISLLAGSRGRPVRVAIEACCGAADLADELAERLGWSVRLAHPGYVARLKRSPDKTDFGDARMLADLTRIGYLPQVWLAPSELRELRRLVRYRQQLVNQRRNTKLRIRALLRDCRVKAPSHFNAWTKPWLAWLETTDQLSGHTKWIMQRHLEQLIERTKQIREVEQLLSKVAADDALVGKLMTYNGIGLITAVMLRAEIGRFDRFATGKQLSRFIGLSPPGFECGRSASYYSIRPPMPRLGFGAGLRRIRPQARRSSMLPAERSVVGVLGGDPRLVQVRSRDVAESIGHCGERQAEGQSDAQEPDLVFHEDHGGAAEEHQGEGADGLGDVFLHVPLRITRRATARDALVMVYILWPSTPSSQNASHNARSSMGRSARIAAYNPTCQPGRPDHGQVEALEGRPFS